MKLHSVNATTFLTETSNLREMDPIGTNLMGSIAVAALSSTSNSTQFWIISNPDPTSFALVSGRGLIMSPSMSLEEAEVLGETIAKSSDLIPQANGDPAAVEAFGKGFRQHRSNAMFDLKYSILVYSLDTLHPAKPTAGNLRLATPSLDREVLLEWSSMFFEFIGDSNADANVFVDDGLARQSLFVWDVNGYPVGFLGYSAPVQVGNVTIYKLGPVFTASDERRKGYASSMTAALSQYLLNLTPTSCRIMLNADAANPAANKAYMNVGFRLHSHSSCYHIQYCI